MIDALKSEPFTCMILVLYASNVAWQLGHGKWGPALYWVAACMITTSATWLMRWGH